ncbi:MAG: NAD-dependent epimerase/dehydratase family protein [bacterium]
MQKTIFDRKNVLVLGGAGFIGSHLCDELVKDSKVICVDNFSTGDEKNIDHLLSDQNFKFIKHDMSEPLDLESMPELELFKVKFQGIQEIYNLACPTSPKHFNEQLIDNLLANSYAVKNSLDVALKYSAKYLHFSTSVVYGHNRDGRGKLSEEYMGVVDFVSSRSAYDEGKQFAETMVINYRRVYNLDAKIMRLFRTYGPRMKLNDNQMIPDFVSNALDDKDLIIFGDEKFSSSLCYVSDVVDAAMKMIQKPSVEILNIGSDIDVSFTNIAKKIINLTDSKSAIKHQPEIFFVSNLPLPDISKALDQLGWLPIVTLDKGLEKTVDDLRASKGVKNLSNVYK